VQKNVLKRVQLLLVNAGPKLLRFLIGARLFNALTTSTAATASTTTTTTATPALSATATAPICAVFFLLESSRLAEKKKKSLPRAFRAQAGTERGEREIS